MKATTQVLLAVCLLAKCFGNCEGKEEKKDGPRAAHITDPAKNEASPTLEIIDFVPFHLTKAKEHRFNLIITFGRNDHPGGRNDGFPEIMGIEPAENPRETAEDNNTDEWLNNMLYVAIAIALALCLSIVGLLVTIGYYQKHKRYIVASRSSSLAGASSGSSPPDAEVRLYPSRLGVANIKLVASLMDEKKTDDLNRLI
ncbi:uncharacterized protein LOC125048136 isoform X2 [Penaeus chinensis]|uniref:uncharacterized protein LOC125048136 isoform X2 n=1 Tax=Penaeus chinensis TaxID=139456 RepID=UPI001FB67179|nr:uncharacterized protein LOC125048136 isoform X2 [Penaeus chinensis]